MKSRTVNKIVVIIKNKYRVTACLLLVATMMGGQVIPNYAQAALPKTPTVTKSATAKATTSPAVGKAPTAPAVGKASTAPAVAKAPTTPAKTSPVAVNPMATSIDEILKTYSKSGNFQGSVIMAQNGTVVLNKGYGLANEEYSVANDPKTVFRLASLSKQITASAILKLTEQGKVKLSDNLKAYFPDYPRGDEITVRMLLNHTSGLQDQTQHTGKSVDELAKLPHTTSDLVAMIQSEPLMTKPGSSYFYSNHGYVLLAAIIEKASGVSYNDYIKKQILMPLGIEGIQGDPGLGIVKNRAEGYQMNNGQKIKATYFDMTNAVGAGSLLGTTEGYLKWLQSYNSTKLMSKASWDQLFDLSTKTNRTDLYDERYGLGVMGTQMTLLSGKTVKMIYHTGGVNGFRNFVIHIESLKLDFVLLSNNEGLDLEELLYALLIIFATSV